MMKVITVNNNKFLVQAYSKDWGFNITWKIEYNKYNSLGQTLPIKKNQSYSFQHRFGMSTDTISTSSFESVKWKLISKFILDNMDCIKKELAMVFDSDQ